MHEKYDCGYVIWNISELGKVMYTFSSRRWLNCRRINQDDRQETDLMTFSKSASLCESDALTLMPLQTQDVKSGASLHQTARSRRSVFELAFHSAALHCALYIVWVAQLQTIFPGQKSASSGVYALCAYWGIH